MSVKQLLVQNGGRVIAVAPDETVFDAIKTMAAHDVSAVLVMVGRRLTGIMTERDYTRKVILRDRSSKTTRVEEIMTAEVISIGPGSDATDCMRVMSERHCRHLPVVDATGAVLGMISATDVLRSLLNDREYEIRQLESYIAGTA